MKFGLLGFPLAHSFSKAYFEKKFLELEIDASFENYEFEQIKDGIHGLKSVKDLKGFSVTIPHKKNILDYLDEIDLIASQSGAVNCVKVTKNNKWKGYNTDIIGFTQSLKTYLKNEIMKALILGNGGAAQAVKASLKELNIPFKIVARKANQCDITFDDLNGKVIAEHTLIINTTPLGTFPSIAASPAIPYEYITEQHIMYDLVYNPAETFFLKKGKEKGATIINGLKMLELQAEAAWDIWQK